MDWATGKITKVFLILLKKKDIQGIMVRLLELSGQILLPKMLL